MPARARGRANDTPWQNRCVYRMLNSAYHADVDSVIAQEMARARLRGANKVVTDGDVENGQEPRIRLISISHLPHELLLHIFRLTLPPRYQHDPSVVQGPRNPWLAALRTRKALALTCKAFSGPATEILYEDIVIRRMGQIPALARTLGPFPSVSGRDVGTLVRRLRMDSCVVWAPCAQVVREDLRLILHRCTALRMFSFHPHPHFPLADQAHNGESQDGFNPSWLMQPDPNDDSVGASLRERLSSSLRILDIAATLDERLLFRMQWFLSAATNLTILKLGPVEPEEYSSELLDHSPLHMPALEELQIYADQESFQHYICARWVLPALTRLTATNCEAFPEALLRAHGSQLTYFHMRHGETHAWELPQLAALARLPALAPRVEHLVIPTWIRDPLVVHSPTLRFLDVWGHHPPAHIVKQGWYKLADVCELPRLERVRILSTMPLNGWESMQSLDWPRICHPLGVRADEQRQLAFPGVRVVQTAWGVLHDYLDEDLSWCTAGVPERRDNSGAYEPEPGDDAESSFGSDGPEAEVAYALREELEELRGHGWDGPVEQYGRDDVLRMYHESQGRAYLFGEDEE